MAALTRRSSEAASLDSPSEGQHVRTRLVQLLDNLIAHAVMAFLVVGILLLAYLVFSDPIGHAYLCDLPGSKVCS
jgi:hypothetical protein